MSYITIPIVRLDEFKKVERLFKIVSENKLGYLAGGFVRFLVSPRKDPSEYRDVDIFTTGNESYEKLLQIFSVDEKLEVKSKTKVAITFNTNNNEVWKDCPMINLIKPLKEGKLLTYGQTMEEVLDNFDFSICRAGILNDKECLAHIDFLGDEQKRNLRILKMESPIAVISRICKYAGKGYKISVPDIVEIFREWDQKGDEYHKKIFVALNNLYSKSGGGPSMDGYVPGPVQKIDSIIDDSETWNGDVSNVRKNENLLELETVDNDENLYDLIRIG